MGSFFAARLAVAVVATGLVVDRLRILIAVKELLKGHINLRVDLCLRVPLLGKEIAIMSGAVGTRPIVRLTRRHRCSADMYRRQSEQEQREDVKGCSKARHI